MKNECMLVKLNLIIIIIFIIIIVNIIIIIIIIIIVIIITISLLFQLSLLGQEGGGKLKLKYGRSTWVNNLFQGGSQ